jgi:Sigma-70, region 4
MSGLNDYMAMHNLEIRVDVLDALDSVKLVHSNPKVCNDGTLMREVIYRRFWLNQSLRDVALDINKTPERIRQIEAKALCVLRRHFALDDFAKRKTIVNS